uniref:GDSL esterase/lipase At5g45910 family n=1 Tax=Cajanus cajan TaxID=3821 RepID=A0A151RL50_CAJCA|nr:GDSL esterase/lipase At5g45910 family [Cajanus cajan]
MKIYILLVIASFTFCFLEKVASISTSRPYDAIFNFGDSISDTGNFLDSGAIRFPVIGKFPYGRTYFKHATGRCSDGRLVIDFIDQNIHAGVNFAVAGATALDSKFFIKAGLEKFLWTNDSLSIQLDWFKKLKPSLCTTKQDCDSYFSRSLFLVGEIGGNDINYAAFAGNITQLQAIVPPELIAEGARELLVPGNFPIGCSAFYLTLFRSGNKEDYDESGCLKTFNGFAAYYNKQLNQALETVRQKNPQARILYADYYGAANRFYHAPGHHGFTNGALRACCGGGGPYNFNMSARCGHNGSKACANSSTYANWDGFHLTEAAYRYIAQETSFARRANPKLQVRNPLRGHPRIMQSPVRFSSCRGVAFEVKPHADPFAITITPQNPSNTKPFWSFFATSRVFPSSTQRSSSKASSHFCDLDDEEQHALGIIPEENLDIEKQNPLHKSQQPSKPARKNESRVSVINF